MSQHSAAPSTTSAPRWNFSYRTKLMAGVCGVVLLTGAVITWLAHRSTLASTTVLVDAVFREVSNHAVTHTRGFVLRAAPLVESLAQLGDKGLSLDDSDRLAEQLLPIFKSNPGLSWLSYGDAKGTFTGIQRVEGGIRINQSRIVDGKTRLIEHDVQGDGSRKIFREDADSGYDPRTRPYYKKAKEQGRLVWLPPYVFFNQGVPGISCSAPVFDETKKLRGVLSVDFDLTALSEFVGKLRLSEHSTVFLLTADEILLAHPNQQKAAGDGSKGELLKLADTRDPLVETYREQLHATKESGESFRLFDFRHGGEDYLASANVFRLGDDLTWVVGAVAPKNDFVGDVWRSQALALAVAGVALVVALALAAWMAKRVSGPVLALIGFMGKVGEGNLDAKADFGGSGEFRQLSEALNRMIGDLRDRLRLRHSLDVAMEVQQRLLPQSPPVVRGLDIAGHSTYCDETGGDYYDFLVLDRAAPDQLLLAIGDVMGHGVAAALVMAGTRAVLRDRACAAGSLTELTSRLNRLLCADHEGTRFMTMHLGVIDAPKRTYRYVGAGHDPAILYYPADDRFEQIDQGDIPLGIMEDHEYTEYDLGPLTPGQVILVGTDGVWEMPDATGQQFGKERLKAVLRECAKCSAEEIAQALREKLWAFRGEQRSVDDVTFVVVKVK